MLCRRFSVFLTFHFAYLGTSPDTVDANLQKLIQLVNKESKLIEKVIFLIHIFLGTVLCLHKELPQLNLILP